MAPRRQPLGVWLDGQRIAELQAIRPWSLRCRYTDDALRRWPRNSPIISCSLPLQNNAQDASAFCKGLLPEGRQLAEMARLARVAANDVHALLDRFGRDVAGALTISAQEPNVRRESVVALSEDDLADEVAALTEQALGLHDDSELSIAGLQDKMLLVDLGNGQWGRPVHGRPSTHILKLDDRRRPGLIAAEAQCLALARSLDLTTVDATVYTIADLECLIVSRFDRRVDHDGTVHRVHQEDACQALGRDLDANRGRGKYESGGGPSLGEVAGLLERFARDIPYELARLLAVTTFNVVIGNADAHGKNLALLHPDAETVKLAPLYDTVPTVLWPQLRTAGAMSINARWELDGITTEDLVDEAGRWSLEPGRARAVVDETLEQLRTAVGAGVIDSGSQLTEHVQRRIGELAVR